MCCKIQFKYDNFLCENCNMYNILILRKIDNALPKPEIVISRLCYENLRLSFAWKSERFYISCWVIFEIPIRSIRKVGFSIRSTKYNQQFCGRGSRVGRSVDSDARLVQA